MTSLRTTLASLAITGAALVAPFTSAHALELPGFQVGIVQGVVSGPDNNPVSGASMSVTCNGSTLGTTTNTSGFYLVQFPNGVCNDGQTVSVDATHNSQTGHGTGVMQDQGTVGILNLDVGIVNIPLVPEFGLVTGAVTLLASAGSYFMLKRN